MFAITFISTLLLVSVANAALNVDITVAYPSIEPFEDQQITATTNQKGMGVIIVVQPAAAEEAWTNSLNQDQDLFDLWNSLSSDVKTDVSNDIGGKIVSYVLVSMPTGGGTETYNFPEDFTGLNGEPSTAIAGTYKVIFAFLSFENQCFKFRVDFACGQWFVVPESPFGTAMALVAPIAVFATIKTYRKRKRQAIDKTQI